MDGRVRCISPCSEILSCGHSCVRRCSEPCGSCDRQLDKVILECGHAYEPSCAEQVAGSRYICTNPTSKHQFPCGHAQDILCSATSELLSCSQKCGEWLECGHYCSATCATCKETGKHADCNSRCDNKLECEHTCQASCHIGFCPPCRAPCGKQCKHGTCDQMCSSICDPCVQPCGSPGCDHQGGCTSICGLPCTSLPCSEPCGKPLRCGLHICPGLCSENCFIDCLECVSGSRQEKPQILLKCGHSFEVEALDEAFRLGDIYKLDLNGKIVSGGITQVPTSETLECPECSRPIEGVRRYELRNQLSTISVTIDRLYAKMGREIAYFVRELQRNEEYLSITFERLCKKLKTGPLAGKQNQKLVWGRGDGMLEVQRHLTKFRDEVTIAFENSVQKLAQLLNNKGFLETAISPYKIRFDLCYFRCRVAMLEDGQKLYQHLMKLNSPEEHTALLMEALRIKISEQSAGEIKAIGLKIADAKALNLKRLEVEFLVVQVCLHMVLAGIGIESELNVYANFRRMRELCSRFPKTAGQLRVVYNAVTDLVEGRRTFTRMYHMYTKDSKELWAALSHHEVGNLQYCQYHHPYSADSFVHCPECGPETDWEATKVQPQLVVDNESKLVDFSTFQAGYAVGLAKLMATYSKRPKTPPKAPKK